MNLNAQNTDLQELNKQSIIRLKYSTPIFEEHGDLHKLTHGFTGPGTDSSSKAYTSPYG